MKRAPHQIVDELFELVNRLAVSGTCLSCEHFNPVTEGCGKANGARPPAAVLVSTCSLYQEIVPF